MSEGSHITFSVEDDGKYVSLLADGVRMWVAQPSAWRGIRDAMTRAIVCAEVMSGLHGKELGDEE